MKWLIFSASPVSAGVVFHHPTAWIPLSKRHSDLSRMAFHLRGERSTGMETSIPAPSIRGICEIRGQDNCRFEVHHRLHSVERKGRCRPFSAVRCAPGRSGSGPGPRCIGTSRPRHRQPAPSGVSIPPGSGWYWIRGCRGAWSCR